MHTCHAHAVHTPWSHTGGRTPRHIPCICHAYTMHIPCIHHAYTMHIYLVLAGKGVHAEAALLLGVGLVRVRVRVRVWAKERLVPRVG